MWFFPPCQESDSVLHAESNKGMSPGWQVLYFSKSFSDLTFNDLELIAVNLINLIRIQFSPHGQEIISCLVSISFLLSQGVHPLSSMSGQGTSRVEMERRTGRGSTPWRGPGLQVSPKQFIQVSRMSKKGYYLYEPYDSCSLFITGSALQLHFFVGPQKPNGTSPLPRS